MKIRENPAFFLGQRKACKYPKEKRLAEGFGRGGLLFRKGSSHRSISKLIFVRALGTGGHKGGRKILVLT